MNESEELAYERGSRMAWVQMLQMCIKHLGYEDTDAQKAIWMLERENVVSTLRQLCEDFGDNEWDENLFLSDVLEKHLGKHLHADRG